MTEQPASRRKRERDREQRDRETERQFLEVGSTLDSRKVLAGLKLAGPKTKPNLQNSCKGTVVRKHDTHAQSLLCRMCCKGRPFLLDMPSNREKESMLAQTRTC